MGEKRRRSKNAGRICEKHRIILLAIDTNTQIRTKKEQTRNDEGIKPQMDKKKDNEDRQRKLELRKK
jgi:hypothetical protein